MGPLGFLNAWLLAGVGAVLIPVILHLRNRRAAERRRFAAIDFLLRSQKRLAARFKLREIILLVLRCAIVAGLAISLAGPMWTSGKPQILPGTRAVSLVLILDDTLSMRCRSGSGTAFEAAVARARQIVGRLRPTDEAALVLVSRPSQAQRLTGDRALLMAPLAQARASYEAAGALPALEKAAALLETAANADRSVIVLSDFRSGTWDEDSVRRVRALCQDGFNVRAIDLTEGKQFDNRAVTALKALQGQQFRQRVRLKVDVENFSARKACRGSCELEVSGEQNARLDIDLPPGGRTSLEFNPQLHRGRIISGKASLPPDDLPEDSVFYFTVVQKRKGRFLVVDGDPRPDVMRSESYYLSHALDPARQHESSLSAHVSTVSQAQSENLSDFDAVALCNCEGTFDADFSKRLQMFVKGGGILLITLGDVADPTTYESDLHKLLPGRFAARTPRTAPPANPLRISRFGPAWPEAAASSDVLHALAPAEVRRCYAVVPSESAGLLLALSDGSALLLGRKIGHGYSLMWCTSIDRDWADVCIQPGFVPALHLLFRNLLGLDLEEKQSAVSAGRSVRVPAQFSGPDYEIVAPGGGATRLRAPAQHGAEGSFGPAAQPGVYRLRAVGDPAGTTLWAFAVNADRRDSTLASHFEDVLACIEKSERERAGRAARPAENSVPLWQWSLLAVLVLLALESVLAQRWLSRA